MNAPKTIGRYEIVDELGHGAMGAVFRARDPAMDRIVALKTILTVALESDQSGEYRQRFHREARAAGALAHPGIVPVFDVGENEGVPFLVMEFVNGQTLADAMKKGERLTMDRVCEIGQQIAEALGYAHRKGVIHRDIKPANILLTSRETYGVERPRITDFGVAKLTAGEITTTGQLLGTPAFMPPEQFTGAPIDGRTDLFSLGVILYWMATGEQPFPGETMTTVSYKIVHTEPVPPAKLNPAIPAQLERVILKCLAKSPADRYQTGEELAQALAEVRGGATPTSMKTAVPVATITGGESEDTLEPAPSLPPKRTSTSGVAQSVSAAPGKPPQKAVAAGSAKKRTGLVVAALAFVALLAAAAGGWFWFQHRNQAIQPQFAPQPAAPQQPAPPPATAPAPAETQAQAPTAATKPSAATPATKTPMVARSTAPQAANTAAAPPPAAPAPQPRLAPVAFDPKTLDPKQNARLKIDMSRIPSNLDFTIEMNGKLYYKGTAGNKADYDTLYVPPGVHEFRVTVSGARTSSIVSAEFVAKKRMSLKVELRPVSSPGSATSDAAAQVVATLKEDHFFL